MTAARSTTTRIDWWSIPRRPGLPSSAVAARWPRRVALVVLAILVGCAVGVPLVTDYDPLAVDYARAALPPGAGGLFGTDTAGRSMAVATAAGLRVSLLIAGAAAAMATVLGTIAGVAAGWLGGRTDQLLMRLVDGVNTIPHLVLGIVLVVFFQGSPAAMVVAIALTHWMQVARIVRTVVLPLRKAEYVQAAAVLGYRRRDLARWHLLPAVAPQAGVSVALLVPHAVWHEATLSFLGVGLAPHQPSLGVLLQAGQTAVFTGDWWQVAVPAAALVTVTVAVASVARGGHTPPEG